MAALIASSLCQSAGAVDWNFTPTLNSSATFTDNVKQSANNRENGLILSVTPGFTLVSEGSRRVQATVGYGVSGVARFGGERSTDVNHNLNATGKAELVEDFLFLDGTARISQELISLLGSPADANTNSSNRATVGTYSFSPYIKKRLSNFAIAQARYTHSGAIFGDNAGSNIDANALTASLQSGTRFNDIDWSLDYSIREAEYARNGATNASNSTFESTSATLGYALSRKFRVFGTVGRDSNDFINASQSNGNFYTAGFGWSPSRRTSLDASAGKRFLGNTYAFSLSHRTRYTGFNVRYSEDISDISRLGTNFNDFRGAQFTCANPALLPPNPTLVDIVNTPGCSANLLFGTSIINGVFISKLLTGGISWTPGRANLNLTLSDLRREFLLGTPREDRTHSLTGSVGYKLTPQTRLLTTLTFTNNQVPAGFSGLTMDRDDNIYTASISLDHRFDPKVTGALTLRRQQRDSNDPAASFDENSLTASLYMRF